MMGGRIDVVAGSCRIPNTNTMKSFATLACSLLSLTRVAGFVVRDYHVTGQRGASLAAPPSKNRCSIPRLRAAESEETAISGVHNLWKSSPQKTIASTALCGLLAVGAATGQADPALGYNPTDYASETVQGVIQSLKDASGDVDKTFKVYEDIAAIITEGRGVGGEINYKGVQLDRGYIADEDTSIYNPGLTLLTESEKERLVEAVITARKDGLNAGQWNEDSELGYEFLRMKLDPFHLVELSGYLKFMPVLTGVVYLAVLAVQQFARGLFPIAYFVGVAAIVAPAVALILIGS